MSRRLTPEEKALRESVANQKRANAEKKKQDRKAEQDFEKRLKQATVDEALELTLNQVPVIPPKVNWSEANTNRVRSMMYVLNGYLNDGLEPPPRDMGIYLYEIDGVSIGVYTLGVIKEIKRTGNLSPCVEEHPYGRNKSGEIIIEWFKNNRDASLEQVCSFVEQFVQFTYSTNTENNGPLKRVQNKDTSNSSRYWKDIYEEAEVRWVYIHFPPGPRTAKHVIQCGELLGMC